MPNSVGVVIIGRNEGDRLIRCLKSLSAQSQKLIYVDSASTDDSVNIALSMGAEVVSLNMTIPFTAARARNEGFERMRKLYPKTKYVQFVDGDCEITAGWIEIAVSYLMQHQNVAAVCGKLRERHPERTLYNMLCNIEWDVPAGISKACGGNSMMRVDAFERARGFDPNLIAGEEPELCMRLRATGWNIWRLDHNMALHDAAMTHFGQWWKRTTRTGYGYAEGAFTHSGTPERRWVKESLRALGWGVGIPIVTLSMVILFGIWGAAILLIYPLQIIRLALNGTRSQKENWWHAFFLVLGKFPEALGQLNFIFHKFNKKSARLIEYK